MSDLRSISLQSALKEFLEPLRTNDSRVDFFAIYRKEAAEFDKDYVQKYDEDLNTTLIFVSGAVRIYLVHADSAWQPGRSVLRSQLRLRNRYPIQTRTGPKRLDRRVHENPHQRRERFVVPRR